MDDSSDSVPLASNDGSTLEEEMEVESGADSDEAEQLDQTNGSAEENPADDALSDPDNGLGLFLDSPSRQFYEREYIDHETLQHLSKDGTRGRRKYVAACKRCGKKVHGTDSFWGFRNHCQLKHGECFLKPEGYYATPSNGSRSKVRLCFGSGQDSVVLQALQINFGLEQIEFVADDELVREVITVPKQEPVEGLPLSRPNKEFFERLYHDHAATKGRKRVDGRSIVRYTARCNKCSHPTSGVDSYYSFKDHFRHKHAGCVEDSAEDALTAKSLADAAGDTEGGIVSSVPVTAEPLPLDKPAKTFFETLYEDHVVTKEEKPDGSRSSSKYSAACKLCSKRVSGTDTFFGFRQHIKSKHKDVQILSYDMAADIIQTSDSDNHVVKTEGSASQPRIFVEAGKSSYPPSKYFYKEMYRDHESFDILPEILGGRKSHRVAASCKACGKFVSAVDSYHNFRHHYLKQHGHSVEVDQEATAESSSVAATNQKAKTAAWSKLCGKGSDQNLVNENVALCAAETLIAMDQLTKPCFDKLVKSLDGTVTVVLQWPTEHLLVETHLPALRTHIKSQITVGLHESPAVSVAAYIWPQDGFFAVVARYIDSAWQIQNPVLAARRVRGQQTTSSVFQSVVGVIEEYGISGKIVFVNALCGSPAECKERKNTGKVVEQDQSLANELKDLLRAQYRNDAATGMVDNVAESLEQVLESAVKSDPALSAFMKRVVGHPVLAKTTKLMNPGTPYTWEIIWEKINAAAEFNWDAAKTKIYPKLSSDERSGVTELLKILQYFEQVFRKLEKTQAAVCDVIPILYGLRHSLTKCQADSDKWSSFIQRIFEGLDEHFEGADESLPYITATFLEPSYKLLWCKASSNANKTEEVKDKVYQQMLPMEPEEAESESVETSEPQPKRPALLSFLGELPGSMPNGRKLTTPVEEMEAYLASDFTHENPLEYWKTNRNRFRRLAVLARGVLFLPVISTCLTELSRVVANDSLGNTESSMETMGFCHLNISFAREYGCRRKRVLAAAE